MNLQENIQRIKEVMGIINEDKNFINRRVSPKILERNFNDALNYVAFLLKFNKSGPRKKMDLERFTNLVIDAFMDNLHPLLSRGIEGPDFPHDSTYDFLKEFYSNRIKERFQEEMNLNENRQGIKEVMGILKENKSLTVRRLLPEIDKLINKLLSQVEYIHDLFNVTKDKNSIDENFILEYFKRNITSNIYGDFFATQDFRSKVDEWKEDWNEVYKVVDKYIDLFYKDKIIDIYNSWIEKNQKQISEQVYDYDEDRNEAPDRLPFDIKKLLDVGAVFVTPAIQGDPKKENYKEWLDEPYTHLITLHNVENSPSDSWIHKAITKQGDYSTWQENFVDKLYDGKYNQILWSLNELGIDPMDMLLDNTHSINESDSTEEYIKKFLKKNYHPIRISNVLKTSNLSFYEYSIRVSFLSKNNNYEDILFTLKFNVDKTANALGNYDIHIFEAGPFYVMGLKNDLAAYILDIILSYLRHEIKNSWFNW